MDDVILLPLKLGIYATMALFALGSAWFLRTRRPLSTSYRLPHEISAQSLLGIPTLYWGIGVISALARPHASLQGVHLEALATLCVMSLSMFWLMASVAKKRHAVARQALYHCLMWGGLISGIIMAQGYSPHIAVIGLFSLCSLLVCSAFTYALQTRSLKTLP